MSRSSGTGDDDHMHRGDGGFFPPPTSPRAVSGGLRIRAARGPIGTTWWTRRWFAALEAMGAGERLERGRAYARGGQVTALDIGLGEVRATVQGTRRDPYGARIRVQRFEQLEWLDVARQLAQRAEYQARLLAGTMPDDIEAAFARAGVSLFPSLEDDLAVGCTCNDWAVPCKHVAAACFLLGEALDADPFLAFRLRGIERDVLLALLAAETPARDATDTHSPSEDVEQRLADQARVDPAAFWGRDPDGAPFRPLPLDLQPPVLDAPLVRILGAPAMWTGAGDFEPAMRRLYARIGSDPRALDLATGVSPATPQDPSDLPPA